MMNKMYKTLEFDKILQMLGEQALSDKAKEKAGKLEPYLSEAEVSLHLNETTEAKQIVERYGNPPLSPMNELDKILSQPGKGMILMPEELGSVSQFLTACRRLKSYLKKAENVSATVASYGNSIYVLEELEEEINRSVRGSQLDDRASPLLADIRRKIANAGEQIKSKLDSLLKNNKMWFSEGFVSVRNGHYTLPVKREYKNHVSGTVIDVSQSGGTYFIEPSAARKLQEDMSLLYMAEENEIRRILYTLTALVEDHHPQIKINIEAMESLDFIFAKAKLSIAMKALPLPVKSERKIEIKAGRHPLLNRKTVVPLDFHIGMSRPRVNPGNRQMDRNNEMHKGSFDMHERIISDGQQMQYSDLQQNDNTKIQHEILSGMQPIDHPCEPNIRGVVITGPNTGGKTVALKTIGLLSLMAQSGLHVPAEAGCFTMNNYVLCDIGDGQSITENLSTFSSHMTNIIQILQSADDQSLVLLDELGSGTDPAEGMGLAIAILEELAGKNCLFVATTHYPEIKEFAKTAPGLINARMAFDRSSLLPLYRLEIGEAGESCALYIAKRLGLPERIITKAGAAAYGNVWQKSLRDNKDYLSGLNPRTPICNNEDRARIQSSKASNCNHEMGIKMQPSNEENTALSACVIESRTNSSNGAKKQTQPHQEATSQVQSARRIKQPEPEKTPESQRSHQFTVGDCVMIFPQKMTGIVYQATNDRGEVGVQVKKNKLLINHKRLKLHVQAKEMYPDDYDFSIVFDSVEDRKKRHAMTRKHNPNLQIVSGNSNTEKLQ